MESRIVLSGCNEVQLCNAMNAASQLSVKTSEIRPWLRLSWLMAMIDDFGGVSIDNVLPY